jgi:alkaline phosphatase D
MIYILAFLVLAAWTDASYDGNLNYHSPSRRHDALGISIPKVQKRLIDDVKSVRDDHMALNFTHGVASGDPLPDGVILWTRLAPTANATKINSPICLVYQVSPSRNFTEVICQGKAYTSSDIDYTVKIDATGLQPFTWYFYRFQSCDGSITSVTGRTKTAPNPDDEVPAGIRFAVYSCANYRMPPQSLLTLQRKGSLMPMVVLYAAILWTTFCISAITFTNTRKGHVINQVETLIGRWIR